MTEIKVTVRGDYGKEHHYTFCFCSTPNERTGREIIKNAKIHPTLKAELLLRILERYHVGRLVGIKRTVEDVIQ